MPSPQQILQNTFGYENFRGKQAEIIDTVVGGKDALVLMPTGGGKSLCYQIPALARAGTALVVSPLIALMQDQVEALQQLGVAAAYLNSSLNAEESSDVFRKLYTGKLELLYVAPERLMQSYFLDNLTVPLSLIAIDEAHCVSQWGHDFRPEYLQLGALAERFPEVPRIALTATADQRTRAEMAQKLQLEHAPCFISSFDRPNIHYRIVDKDNAKQQFLRFHQQHQGEAGVIYCLSRKKVESTAQWLQEHGINALPYHAGLPQAMRAKNQARFLREDGLIIVATVAFGMGIDKPDVRFVAHLDLPKSLEAYYQETGRAGRDGEPSEVILFYGLGDAVNIRRMLERSQAPADIKRIEEEKLEALLGFCETTLCRRQVLLRYFGEDYPQPCENCDTCQHKPETIDGTVVVQKLLSCIYRTGQRFGAGHVIDVLLGKDSERIRNLRHDKLSTYGIGTEMHAKAWRAVVRQLIASGYLSTDADGYRTLQLTKKSAAVLKGAQKVMLREPYKAPPRPPAAITPATSKRKEYKKEYSKDVLEHDKKLLFEALRKVRLQLALEQGVPPYIIFHDSTLVQMAVEKPRDKQNLRKISGVGERKLERYGEAFLQVLRQPEVALSDDD